LQRPTCRGCRVPQDTQKAGRLSGNEGHFKLIQRHTESVSSRFDVRLFATPAIEKPLHPARWRQGAKHAYFLWSKEAPGDLLRILKCTDPFNIDAYIAATGKSVEGQVASV
jgi:hypothetical protein